LTKPEGECDGDQRERCKKCTVAEDTRWKRGKASSTKQWHCSKGSRKGEKERFSIEKSGEVGESG